MILVFASELDDNARDAVTNWSKQNAVLLTPADFFCNGWFATTETIDNWSIVAAGKRYPVSAISGVVTLISRIFSRELFDVEPEERTYAAAEASAFALFFLSKLPCHVVNRPTPDCLTGPNWRPEQWAHACFKAGIRTKKSQRTDQVPPQEVQTPRLTSVTVLAGKCVEDTSEGCLPRVLTLARLADVAFLRCYFILENSESFFYRADVIPDISKADIRNALSEYFCAFNS